jgi:hypothetical protein
MKEIAIIHDLLRDIDFTEKIRVYFSTKYADESFDSFEQNYTLTHLNPIVIRGLLRTVSPEALIWKEYGLSEIGSVEIIAHAKYKEWFKKAMKVEINGDFYTVWKDGTGGRSIIQDRPNRIIRVILKKVG